MAHSTQCIQKGCFFNGLECGSVCCRHPFFFKLSATCRADYKSMVKITDVVAEYAMKHSTTSWVTLWKVLVRLIEQYDNLKEYFLTFSPTTSSEGIFLDIPSKQMLKRTNDMKEFVRV